MFPSVWSSLLKVKMDVDGMPEAGQYERGLASGSCATVMAMTKIIGLLTRVDRFGDLLLLVTQQKQLEAVLHVSL